MYLSLRCMNACHKAKGVKGVKEKKKVPGWCIEEVREKPNITVEEVAEEV